MNPELMSEYRAPEYIPGYGEASPISPRMFYSQKMRNYVDNTPIGGEDSGLAALNRMLEQLNTLGPVPQQSQAGSQRSILDFLSELGGMYKQGLGDFLTWRSKQGPDVSKGPLEGNNLDALLPTFMGSTGISGSAKTAASSAADSLAPYLSKLKDIGGYVGAKVKEFPGPAQETTQIYQRVPSNYTLRDVWDTLVGQGDEAVKALVSKSGRPKQGGYAESLARYLEPTDETAMRDLALLFRKQPGKAWDLVHGEPNLFEMGVKSPKESSNLNREYDWFSPLNALYDKATQGVSDIGSQIVNNLADKFPTAGRHLEPGLAQLVEQGGRTAANALSDVTDALRRAGAVQEPTSNWYAKTRGTTRKRYIASGPKNAPEGSDLWQRDVLKNMYRDIKPSYNDMYKPYVDEWLPVAKALSPLLGIPAITPNEMWSDAARLTGIGKDTVSNPDNPGLLESIGYLLGY